jgi:F-type H+-transporting ATPase subunit b
MPQLDVSTFATQIFWLAVSFIVLYVLMSRLALPRIGAILAMRANRIEGDLDAARRLKTEAEAAIAAYDKALAEARAKAQAEIAQTNAQITAEQDRRRQELEAILSTQAADAEARIRATRDAALADLKVVAADVARAMASKLAGTEIGADAAANAVARELERA